MSIMFTCDYCGQPIDEGSRVTINALGRDRSNHINGYLGHYHASGPEELTCYEAVRDVIELVAEWGPVASRDSLDPEEVADQRRQHVRVCDSEALERMGERWIGELDLHAGTYRALAAHVETVRQLCALTPDELRAVQGIGKSRADKVIAALAEHGLALARVRSREVAPG